MDIYTDGVREVAKEVTVASLARQLGMSESRLYKKLDPDGSVNLTLEDFFRIAMLTRDLRGVQPILDEMGYVAVKASTPTGSADLSDLLLNHQVTFGSVAQAIRNALADESISAKEAADIDQSITDELSALCELRGELKAMIQPRLAK